MLCFYHLHQHLPLHQDVSSFSFYCSLCIDVLSSAVGKVHSQLEAHHHLSTIPELPEKENIKYEENLNSATAKMLSLCYSYNTIDQEHTDTNRLLQLLCTQPPIAHHTMTNSWQFYYKLKITKRFNDCLTQLCTSWWWTSETQNM